MAMPSCATAATSKLCKVFQLGTEIETDLMFGDAIVTYQGMVETSKKTVMLIAYATIEQCLTGMGR